ncbi:hypothetical protein JYU34_021472 [Plutella xylostella]|uniref:Uncharacterized protein n=1 Tax=Plutella xylostella TaxID=51655 RepID=A0ABQ7PTU7_PLUXY|nr:hypothetical protein JYU34_021472 [Plutella xylostella]
MQETVTNTNERKTLFSSYFDILESKEKQAQEERQLQEEKYLRRTQKIYEFHERQRREAVELRRCLDYVSSHAHVLETVLRGSGTAGEGPVPLSAALVRQAATLQRCMAQCVANASKIRQLLTATHRDQMDSMLNKMENELRSWTAFLHRAVDATYNTEIVVDNLHNMIAEQRRYVREVSSSTVLTSLCAEGEGGAAGDGEGSPHDRRPPSNNACSTPIARD